MFYFIDEIVRCNSVERWCSWGSSIRSCQSKEQARTAVAGNCARSNLGRNSLFTSRTQIALCNCDVFEASCKVSIQNCVSGTSGAAINVKRSCSYVQLNCVASHCHVRQADSGCEGAFMCFQNSISQISAEDGEGRD